MQKRKEYINWEEYFVSIALLAAKRSKDPTRQVGACIVNERNRILSIGYNGFPTGIDDTAFPWGKGDANPLNNKFAYVVHAELNAILSHHGVSFEGTTLFVALFPCNECAKAIIQAGIKEIVFLMDHHHDKWESIAARSMFDQVGISYRQYQGNIFTLQGPYTITWDMYFMAIASLSAMRSKDPSTQVGACIVDAKNQMMATGYNGMPNGISDELFPWGRDSEETLNTKYPYVVHAEQNAILNANGSLDGASLYVGLFPCNECAKSIIQAGIKKVIYLEDKYHDTPSCIASRRLLTASGVEFRSYDGLPIRFEIKKT